MSGLARLQGDFQDYLLRGGEAIGAHVEGGGRVPVATRLGIYAHAYRSRLAAALATNYPALAKLLDEDFEVLAHAYIDTHDSPYFSIRWYGEELAQFLEQREPYAGAPLLAELARWEWAMTCVFDAADAAPLAPAALGRIRPEEWAQLRFTWHPSVTRLALNWNVPQTWKALTGEGERPALEYHAQGTPWLLWRQDLTTWFRSLPEAEAQVLDAARAGEPFAQLCELLCDAVGEAAAPGEAAALLRGWIEAGLITGTA
jgi:hypothetical protein